MPTQSPESDAFIRRFRDAFGEITRVEIMLALAKGRANVGEIAEAIQVSRGNTSNQLTILRVSGLVVDDREGKHVFYSLTPVANELLEKMQQLLQLVK